MTAPHTAPADPRRRLMIMVGVGLALGVLLFLAAKMLAGGGTAEGFDEFATPSPTPQSPTTVAPAAPEAQAGAPVETFEVFTTKNPFIPLRTIAATSAVAGSGTAPATASSTGSAPAPATAVPAAGTGAPPAVVPAATSTSAGTATAATGGQATEPTRSGTRVALLDVFAEGGRTVANVKVNDTVSKVGAGDTFASNFKVVSLDPAERCGRFLYGDDQFRLCKGEEALK